MKTLREIPNDVNIAIARACKMDGGAERMAHIQQQKKAYCEMMDYIEGANIPEGEKEAIIKNVGTVYKGNYIRQKIEAESMVQNVLHIMEKNK